MKTPHTPGPWFIETNQDNNAEIIRAHQDGEMFDLASVLCDETNQANANARLIAAAPALLAALQSLATAVDQFVPLADEWPELSAARAAIAQATGEQA